MIHLLKEYAIPLAVMVCGFYCVFTIVRSSAFLDYLEVETSHSWKTELTNFYD